MVQYYPKLPKYCNKFPNIIKYCPVLFNIGQVTISTLV